MEYKLLNKEEKQKIADKLSERIPSFRCPMCGHNRFTVSSGYFLNLLHNDISTVRFEGYSIPAASIICDQCGFISQHALGELDMMAEDEELDKMEKEQEIEIKGGDISK